MRKAPPPPPFPLWRRLQGGLRAAGSWAGLRGRGCPAFSACAAPRAAQRPPPSPAWGLTGCDLPPPPPPPPPAGSGPHAADWTAGRASPAPRCGLGRTARSGWGRDGVFPRGVGWGGVGGSRGEAPAPARGVADGSGPALPGRARLRSGRQPGSGFPERRPVVSRARGGQGWRRG